MSDERTSDNPPVYVIKASLVQWLIFGSIVYAIVSMSSMKEQFQADMESQKRLFEEANKLYLQEQHNTMYDILASKLKELRVSFDESNKITEAMCKP
jgi:biopolymer transport protein ExbB/TolQ